MPRLFQYQGLAEPVEPPAPPAETISVDKWFTEISQPLRRKSQVHLYPSLALPEPASYTESITLDKWFTEISQPVRGKRNQHLYPSVFHVDVQAVSIPSIQHWFQPLSLPVRVPPRMHSSRMPFSFLGELPLPPVLGAQGRYAAMKRKKLSDALLEAMKGRKAPLALYKPRRWDEGL